MSAIILDGKKAREAIFPKLEEKIGKLPVVPTLAIVQVGMRPDSTAYIGAKLSFANKIGVKTEITNLSETSTEQEIINKVNELNLRKDVDGIIVQLPLPKEVDKKNIVEAIDPNKDVDVLSSTSIKRFEEQGDNIIPATARGIKELLNFYKIDLHAKKVTVVGRSALVGSPVAKMCRLAGAEVTVCHSKTSPQELIESARKADILIVAAGHAKLIGTEHVRGGQVVVDVGINTVTGEKLEEEMASKKLVGDTKFDEIKDIVYAITPVPGGVGPMTVLALF